MRAIFFSFKIDISESYCECMLFASTAKNKNTFISNQPINHTQNFTKMASNVVQVNVYNINGDNVTGGVQAMAFPTQGCLLRDNINSPTRSLSTGVSVYSNIQFQNAQYYTTLTIAQLVTAFNA